MRWSDSTFGSIGLAPVTRLLLASTVAVYLVQVVVQMAGVDFLTSLFGLSVGGLMQGKVWQVVTYIFLHGGPLHLLMNMLMLFFLGSEVERSVGRVHFLVLYFLSGVLGGLGWALLMWPYEGVCVGASGAIFGLLGAFATLYPQRDVVLLLFFVFPITMRAWVLTVILAAVQFLMMVSPYAGGVAYSAHLAGGLAGMVYILTLFRPDVVGGWLRHGRRAVRGYGEDRRRAARAEQVVALDRLLDKVAQQGLHSLTPAERRQLEKASAQLRGR